MEGCNETRRHIAGPQNGRKVCLVRMEGARWKALSVSLAAANLRGMIL